MITWSDTCQKYLFVALKSNCKFKFQIQSFCVYIFRPELCIVCVSNAALLTDFSFSFFSTSFRVLSFLGSGHSL